MKNIGEYKHLITINAITESSDGMGGFTESSAADISNIWANVKTIKGDRALEFNRLRSGIWYEIDTMANVNDTINTGGTITFGSKTLTIHQIFNIDESDWTVRIIAYSIQPTI